MTENTVHPEPSAATPPPPPEPSPVFERPPLRRPSDDRVVVGVAAGVARYLRIDPVIVRVLFVVLAVFGGIGVVLYALGWLLIPDAGDAPSRGRTLLDQAGPPGSVGRIAMTVVGLLLAVMLIAAYADAQPFPWLWGLWGFGGIPLLLLAIGGIALWLYLREQPPARTSAPMTTDSAPTISMQTPPADAGMTGGTAAMTAPLAPPSAAQEAAGFAYGGSGGYPGYTAPTPAPAPAPRPPRQRSYLGLATLSISAVVVGVLAMLNVAGATSIPAVVVLSAGLAVLSAGILIGAFAGRARWLVAIAAPLLLVTALVAVIPAGGVRLNGGVGERSWLPLTTDAAAGPFRLGIGDATLDLTRVVFAPGSTQSYPVDVSQGVGSLKIIVPSDADVVVDAHVGLGSITVDNHRSTGGSNRDLETTLPSTTSGAVPTIVLDANLNLGDLEVSRG